jgi:hypothetical protein
MPRTTLAHFAAPCNDASCAVWTAFGAAFGVEVCDGAVDGPLWAPQ